DSVTMRVSGDNMALVGSVGRELIYVRISSSENLMTGEVSMDRRQIPLAPVSGDIQKILVDPLLQWMYVFNGDQYVNVYSLRQEASLLARYPVVEGADRKVTSANLLLGGISLLIGDNQGNLAQWFMVLGEGTAKLTQVRTFD